MTSRKFILTSLFFLLATSAFSLELSQLKLPPGFKISVFARIPYARQLNVARDGMIYVGSSHHQGNNAVYAIKPSLDLTHAEKIYTLATGLDAPIGVAYYNNNLYIGEHFRISKIPNITGHWDNPSPIQVVRDHIPDAPNGHGRKYLKFGPDQRLYFSVGDPLDTSQSDNPYIRSLLSINPNGSDLQVYASGIRSCVGFDWEPGTKILWFTDNGQDRLGDDFPPDEINRAPNPGMHFGFPCYVGDNVRVPPYTHCPPLSAVTPPAFKLEAHAAALGLMFYTGSQFPADYKNNMFIAEHGSSIRRDKLTGYQVLRVVINGDRVIKTLPFISGWQEPANLEGRPVDVAQLPDGSLLISDDWSGRIYRVTYSSELEKQN